MLATDTVVRDLFVSWLSIYAMLNILLQWIMYHVSLQEEQTTSRIPFNDPLCSER